jgi:hypothetical protein
MIPIQPMALRLDGGLDVPCQRALTRYYRDAGAGGLAVGCSTVPLGSLYRPLLQLTAEALSEVTQLERDPLIRIAAVSGSTPLAVEEACSAAELGYHLALVDLGQVSNEPRRQLEHFAAIAAIMPAMAAAAGRASAAVAYETWRELCESGHLAAVQLGGPDRRATLDAIRAVRDTGLDPRIALYTGNEDAALMDLVSRFPFTGHKQEPRLEIVGGVLRTWGFWTRRWLDHFNEAKRLIDKRLPISRQYIELAMQAADVASAVLGPSPSGVLEVLRRQELVEQVLMLDPDERLSARQTTEIDRIYRDYTHLHDDPFVELHAEDWFA